MNTYHTPNSPARSPYLFRDLVESSRPDPEPAQPPRLPPDCEPDSEQGANAVEPIHTLEAEHPWLLALYALVLVASCAASAVWPYWVQP